MDITQNISKSILEIKKYKSGSSINEYIKEFGIEKDSLIELASNENPYGCSPIIKEKIPTIINRLSLYPEADYSALKKKFAAFVKVTPENITVGNGSNELYMLISVLFAQNKAGLIPEPTFTWYRTCLLASNAKVVTVPISEKKYFVLTSDEIINAVGDDISVVFIASPNNPTAYRMPYSELKKVVESCEKQCIVIDEAYYDFCNDKSAIDLIEYDNVIVTRTMSKAFGLAGMRVGFAVSNKKIIDLIEKIKTPFNINAIGLMASITALEDQRHHDTTVRAIKEERDRVYTELTEIKKIMIYKSDANFLFMNVKFNRFNSEKIFVELLKKGILVRNCSSFELCSDKFLRVTIGTPQENDIFLRAIREILKD